MGLNELAAEVVPPGGRHTRAHIGLACPAQLFV